MFNALKYTKELEEAGYTPQQAEAAINVFFKFMEYNFATKEDITNLRTATKEDIVNLRTELKGDIISLRTEVKEDITSLRTELKEDIHSLRTEFTVFKQEVRHDIQTLEYKMTIKFGLMQAASVGLLAGLIKFF